MSGTTIIVGIHENDVVNAYLADNGKLAIEFTPDLVIFVEHGNRHFARFCDVFDLQEESAPAENEDGAPLEVVT